MRIRVWFVRSLFEVESIEGFKGKQEWSAREFGETTIFNSDEEEPTLTIVNSAPQIEYVRCSHCLYGRSLLQQNCTIAFQLVADEM